MRLHTGGWNCAARVRVSRLRGGRPAVLVGLMSLAGLLGAAGCSGESTRIALEAQRRANEVEQALFDRQQDGLKVLLYRDVVRRIEAAAPGADLAAEVSQAWNERDLLEFWAVQHERAKALRTIGVDAQLYSRQAVFDLLLKAVDAKARRLDQAVAQSAAQSAAQTAARAATQAGGVRTAAPAGEVGNLEEPAGGGER